jgi:hypothetical protein
MNATNPYLSPSMKKALYDNDESRLVWMAPLRHLGAKVLVGENQSADRVPSMNEITTVGLDLAKNVFQVHGVDAEGTTVLREQLRRAQLLAFFSRLPRCLVGMEACATAHYWARELRALGHEVRRSRTSQRPKQPRQIQVVVATPHEELR